MKKDSIRFFANLPVAALCVVPPAELCRLWMIRAKSTTPFNDTCVLKRGPQAHICCPVEHPSIRARVANKHSQMPK